MIFKSETALTGKLKKTTQHNWKTYSWDENEIILHATETAMKTLKEKKKFLSHKFHVTLNLSIFKF